MKPWARILIGVVAAIAGAWLGFSALNSAYLRPRAALTTEIEGASAQVSKYQAAKRDRRRVSDEIQQFVNRTLGGNLETVDHRLRSRLNRLAEGVGLQGLTVGTAGSGKVKDSPAKSLFSGSGPQRALRDEPDLVELEAWVSGFGSLEQVLQLVDAVESEPWLKRLDQLDIDPRDNGSRFDVTVRLTTLFLPGREPDPTAIASTRPVSAERYVALAQVNPFRVPPPPPPPPTPDPQPITDPQPQRTQTFAYQQWSLVGVASGPAGIEAWVINRQTKETRRIGLGEALHEAILVSANGEAAEFQVGHERVTVSIGQNLSDRRPAGQ